MLFAGLERLRFLIELRDSFGLSRAFESDHLHGLSSPLKLKSVPATFQSERVSLLMAAYRAGNVQAGSELLELFYPELKMLAARHLKSERSAISWQPTLLVNELYLQLVKVKAVPPAQADHHNDRGAFGEFNR